jgi:hypothetical protein
MQKILFTILSLLLVQLVYSQSNESMDSTSTAAVTTTTTTTTTTSVTTTTSALPEEGMDQKGGFVKLNSRFSYLMLDPVHNLRKINILLKEKAAGQIKSGNLYLGTSLISILDYQDSNTDSKFAYLMRHPTSNNQIGNTVSEAVIHSAQLALTGTVNSWLSVYAEMLYNPEQSFGSGTITALGRNQFQLRKGYVLFGDLNKFPLYLAIGKMDSNFGQTGSVSPFTNSTMWHAFGGLAYGATLGFEKKGFNASFMAIQGGAQFRALHVPVDTTNVPSRLNNFAFDANYNFTISEKTHFVIGGSYVHGTAYCQGFPVFHFMPCQENNPASTVYASLDFNNRFHIKGGYAITSNVWEGTHNPAPPLNEFEASKVSSMDIGAKYNFKSSGKINYCLSFEFSDFVAGPDGAPWHRQTQTVLGLTGMIQNSSKLFVEVFRTTGYAPLNWISGGNFEDLGVTHSDADARSVGIVVGGQITL